MANQLLGATELGLVYGLMVLGVYITFRILKIPDLTVDGSVVLGMSVTAVVTNHGADEIEDTADFGRHIDHERPLFHKFADHERITKCVHARNKYGFFHVYQCDRHLQTCR